MIGLVVVVSLALSVSFLCSLTEVVLLSVRRPYLEVLMEKKSGAASRLLRFKENIDEPISAILTLNTVANTIGAAVSGAMALDLFGSRGMAIFSAGLTLAVLTISEIIPKTIGATYWKTLAPAVAYLLSVMILITKPIFLSIRIVTRWISKDRQAARISKGEILHFIRMGYFQGVIRSSEFRIMENLFRLHEIKVKDIMTPRTVVFWLSPEQKTDELAGGISMLRFSRVPLYNVHQDVVEGVVLRRDIVNHLAGGGASLELKELARKPEFVVDKTSVYRLLNLLIANKIHLAVVLSEYGDFVGIVTMEDAIETLLGKEIVDEYDAVEDMRKLATKKGASRMKEGKKQT